MKRDPIHIAKLKTPPAFEPALLDDELTSLSVAVDEEHRKHGMSPEWGTLCKVYQALWWARNPRDHAPPSEFL